MLSASCRRFRRNFTPGSAHPHRRTCRECDAFAAALESAAGVRLPVPEALRRSLRTIAGPEPDAALPFASPRLPVPDALARRLRGIAPARRSAPPEWVLHPRYAVAASALLALLLGPFVPGALDRGLRLVGTVQGEVIPLVQRTGERGRAELGRLDQELHHLSTAVSLKLPIKNP